MKLTNPTKQHFVGFAESLVRGVFCSDEVTDKEWVEALVKFLSTLYEPSGPAMISFQREFVTMEMLCQFVYSLARESSDLLDGCGRNCTFPGIKPMLPVYEMLKTVHEQFLNYAEIVRLHLRNY